MKPIYEVSLNIKIVYVIALIDYFRSAMGRIRIEIMNDFIKVRIIDPENIENLGPAKVEAHITTSGGKKYLTQGN